MRIVLIALLLSGCTTAPTPDAASSQSGAPETDRRFWTATPTERSRAEDIARRYAVAALRLSQAHVAKMKTDCSGHYKGAAKELWIQFYDAEVFHPLPSGGFEAMVGGFPRYFTITVDVRAWKVVDHYASPE